MSWLLAIRTRRLLVARRATESRMDEEFRFHLEMETERLVREAGLEPEEARRHALVAFGGVERHKKEELRDGRGLRWVAGLSLDLKLGLRMLVKYPGLTSVEVAGMAVAVAICAASFGIISVLVDSALPLPAGDRMVAIRNLDTHRSALARSTHLHDLATWRSSLTAVEDLGAYRTIDRNLITPGGHLEPVSIAEMSASGFRLTRVPPLIGRYFTAADEHPGAPPVAVIGYTVWTPLRLDPLHFVRGHAPALNVFGRLAPGATLQDAQRQLDAIGARLAAAYPAAHHYIRPRVLPYARAHLNPGAAWQLHLAELLVSLLLVVIGTNVAILVYARTATRSGEIAVRSALGASRGRIVAQLFAEALVLSVVAAAVGIVGARVILQQIDAFIARLNGWRFPFWWHFDISPSTVVYVMGLAVFVAVIVGVVLALKATRRQVHASLQQLGAGGSGM